MIAKPVPNTCHYIRREEGKKVRRGKRKQEKSL
jgi:hypothetical protein